MPDPLHGRSTASGPVSNLKSIQQHLSPDEEDPYYIAQMKDIIKKDFAARTLKNLNVDYLLKATALDPRFKKLKGVDDNDARDRIYNYLSEEAKENQTED